MEENKLNFNRAKRGRARRVFRKFKPVLILATIIILTTLIWSLLTSSSSVSNFSFSNPFSGPSIKSTDDRVNVLLLGNAGGTHDGPSLTDSIIIASYNLKTNNVILISVPRDLWVESAKAKVNAVYEFAEQKDGNGLEAAKDKIDDLLGFPIHYAIRLNFDGFSKAIDLVDGVNVEVPKTFDDFNYPIEGKEDDLCGLVEKEVELTEEQIKALNIPESKNNLKVGKNKVLVDASDKIATDSGDFSCRFEHVHFDQGEEQMDGETALKFVRSRQGTNGEGSDFARSRRQQLVLQAFRSKVLSLETLANPTKISGLVSTLGQSVETDIGADRYLDFYNLIKKTGKVESIVLGDLGKGQSILYSPPPSGYGGAYVLIPKDNDFKKVQDYIKQKFDEDKKE